MHKPNDSSNLNLRLENPICLMHSLHRSHCKNNIQPAEECYLRCFNQTVHAPPKLSASRASSLSSLAGISSETSQRANVTLANRARATLSVLPEWHPQYSHIRALFPRTAATIRSKAHRHPAPLRVNALLPTRRCRTKKALGTPRTAPRTTPLTAPISSAHNAYIAWVAWRT